MQHKKILFCCLTIFVLVLKNNNLLAGDALVLTGTDETYPLGKHLYLFEDEKNKKTLADILKNEKNYPFRKNKQNIPYLGFKDSTIWASFTLKNEAENNKRWLLYFSYPLMDHISLYTPDSNGAYREITTGYRHYFDSRPIRHRHFIFPLELTAGMDTKIYMRFKNEDRMEIPLTVWSTEAFFEKNHDEQYVMGIYFGILFFMLIFNLLFFITIKDRSYLYYIFFLFGFAFFQLTQNGYTFEYFTPRFLQSYSHFIPSSIALALITTLAFTASFLAIKKRNPRLYKIFQGLMIFLGAMLASPLFVSYATAINIQLFSSFVTFALALYAGVVSFIKRYRPSYFYLMAWAGTIFGGIVYGLKVAGIIQSNFFGNYALQIGSVFQFVLLSFGLGDRVNMLRIEREDAEDRAILSEERFKLLMDNSEDIVFTLDEGWNFSTINKAVSRHFKITPETAKNKNLLDLIYSGGDLGSVTRQLIHEKLIAFSKTREPIVFMAPFKSPIITEPNEMKVRLEYINIEGKNEIFGKASHIQEDSLLKYFKSESQSFEIGNYLVTADDISHRVSRNLNRYTDSRHANLLRIAVREMIINAIEHGNLNISNEEKSRAILADQYLELIYERQQDPKFSNKKVQIEYSIMPDKAVYTITDDGNGFDHKKFLSINSAELNQKMDQHGRGILITKNIFDEILYNESGNQVRLIKFF